MRGNRKHTAITTLIAVLAFCALAVTIAAAQDGGNTQAGTPPAGADNAPLGPAGARGNRGRVDRL